MKRTRRLSIASAALLLLTTTAHAASDAGSPDIVVHGIDTDKNARTITNRFTHSSAGGLIARWNDRLCLSVQGLTPSQVALILPEIEKNAADVGIHTKDQPCTWNVLIAFASDADSFAASLVKQHPGLFRDYYRYGLASLHDRATVAAPRPVRWLPVERSVGGVGSGASAERAHIDDASHISTNVTGEKFAELIIIDPQRISGITWQQLADYLSMVILTDPSMDEPFADGSSIMSIFTERDLGESGPAGLTSIDKRVLQGYYHFDEFTTPDQQVGTIMSTVKSHAPHRDDKDTAP